MTSVQTIQSGGRVQTTLHLDKHLDDLLGKFAVHTKRTKSGMACLILEDWFRNADSNLQRIDAVIGGLE